MVNGGAVTRNTTSPAGTAPHYVGPRLRKVLEERLDDLQSAYEAVQEEERVLDESIRIAQFRKEALDDFYTFATKVMGFEDLYPPLHGPLCRLVQDGNIKRKLILLPRGCFKTTICSISYPLWLLVRDQNARIALCSVNSAKAEENLDEIYERAKGEIFQLLFGDIIGHPDTWPKRTKSFARIRRKGSKTGPSLAAYSVECSEVGRHFDTMVFDDIVDQEKVNTPQAREGVWEWFGRQFSVRDPGTEMMIIGTRWHWDDVYSRIQKHMPKYAENKEVGWHTERRSIIENGKIIFPARFTHAELEEIRKVQGDYIFSCFYYNEPAGEGTNPFDIRRISWVDYVPEKSSWTYILVDPASTRENYSCHVGIVVGDALPSRKFIVREAILEKMHPDQLVDTIFRLVGKHAPYKVVIEDESFQKSLKYWLRREMRDRGIHFQIDMVKNPRNVSQPMRLLSLQPYVNNGAIKFAHGMPGAKEMMEEFETYPKGPHKDLICALYMITASVFPPQITVRTVEKPPPPRSRQIMKMLSGRKNGRFMPFTRIGGK
jgi:predicted phage terminase large subunit-like protein